VEQKTGKEVQLVFATSTSIRTDGLLEVKHTH
jgi:hypothetical protein